MKLVIFKTENGDVAINPYMVTSVSAHFTKPDSTVVVFDRHDEDYCVVDEDFRSVVARLTAP